MPANGRSCGKCDYWEPSISGCMLHAPVILLCSNGSAVDQFVPRTKVDSWCGQFKLNQENVVKKHESKSVYGSFKNVKLTDEELRKLHDKFGVEDTVAKIRSMSSYLASKGDKYKSHYATILQWAERDQKDNPVQQGPIY